MSYRLRLLAVECVAACGFAVVMAVVTALLPKEEQ